MGVEGLRARLLSRLRAKGRVEQSGPAIPQARTEARGRDSPLRGLGTLGGCVQRHIRSLVPSTWRGLVELGASRLSSSIRGRLASSVAKDTARFLVIRPTGDSGEGCGLWLEGRGGGVMAVAPGRGCLGSAGSAPLEEDMAGCLRWPGIRWEELTTSVILEGDLCKRRGALGKAGGGDGSEHDKLRARLCLV